MYYLFFFFQAEDGIRDHCVTGVQTCALPIYIVLNVFRAVEFGPLARMNFVSLAAGGNFAFAANHGYAGGVAVFIYVNAKRSCFLDGESQVRSVDFVMVALAKFANA